MTTTLPRTFSDRAVDAIGNEGIYGVLYEEKFCLFPLTKKE